MTTKYHLGISDYLVIGISLLLCVIIGIKVRFGGAHQDTTNDFFMAGKKMPKFPVVMSIAVTTLSAVSMLGSPAESYRFGVQYSLVSFSLAIGMVLAAYIALPVFFQCGVSTAYEFLEIRFGKATKYIFSALFIIEMVLYMAIALYCPALALSAVTDIPIETSIILIASVCTFYCSLGGLKAVLWTDVLQAGLMFTCIIIAYIVGVSEAGGISMIYYKALKGERFNLLDFNIDFTLRHNFWGLLSRGIVGGLGSYGFSQLQVQRIMSLSSCKRAQSTLLWSILPVVIFHLLLKLFGMVLFTVFYLCDPILNEAETGLSKYDQLFPYFIVSRLNSMPCLTGLCIAGIFSGALSTISSAINSVSAVTVADFILPIIPDKNLNEKRLVFISKGLGLFYGGICVCLSFLVSRADSILHVTNLMTGLADGSSCAVFLIGIFSSRVTEKNILFGLVIGSLLPLWIGIGNLFSGYKYPSLPLNTSLCSPAENISRVYNLTESCSFGQNCSVTFTESVDESGKPFFLHRISFSHIPVIIYLSITFVTLIGSFLSGSQRAKTENRLRRRNAAAKTWTKNASFDRNQRDTAEHKESHKLTSFDNADVTIIMHNFASNICLPDNHVSYDFNVSNTSSEHE